MSRRASGGRSKRIPMVILGPSGRRQQDLRALAFPIVSRNMACFFARFLLSPQVWPGEISVKTHPLLGPLTCNAKRNHAIEAATELLHLHHTCGQKAICTPPILGEAGRKVAISTCSPLLCHRWSKPQILCLGSKSQTEISNATSPR